jgi:hypothetical protein
MKRKIVLRLSLMTALLLMLVFDATGWAIAPAPAEPNLQVCDNVTCETLQASVCSEGFKITLTNYQPAAASDTGTAIYEYEVCDAGAAECPIANFSNLTHFDVRFPELGCLAGNIEVNWDCSCETTTESGECEVIPASVRGDAICLPGEADYLVAKCNVYFLDPGRCFVMTVRIAGETTGLGLGAAIVIGATTASCNASCLAGPSCTPCEEAPPGAEACLTRTKGFWGRHPHIARLFDPVTVCGVTVEGTSPGKCSTTEALCSNAHDYRKNPAYLRFVEQLTAAKLNLNATAALTDDVGTCAAWEYQDNSIQEWIGYCEENCCQGSKEEIIDSGCIEALTAFNRPQDTGFEVTPPPFDRPEPAIYRNCQAARGNGMFIGHCPEERPPDCYHKEKKWRRYMPIKHPKDRWGNDCDDCDDCSRD